MIQTQRTVLVVDDSPEDCELYRRYLLRDTEYHYTFLTAHMGEEGLELWQRHQPDAVLLDYRLPDLDGLEFLATLQTEVQQPYLPVIMVTGQGNESIAVQSMKAGAQEYLVKGQITPEGLHLAVNEVIEKVQLRTELHQRIERERLVAQITEQIHRSFDLDTILQTTVDEVRRLLRTDRAFIYRFQPDFTGVVAVESAACGWTSILEARVEDQYFMETHGEDYRQGRIQAVADIYTAGLSQCHVDLLARFAIRANLVVPIVQGNVLWGLLVISQCSEPRQWKASEIELVQHLAIQLGIALQQAELYQQAQRELAERRQAETALKDSEGRLRQLTENIDAVFWIKDFPSRRVLYISPAYERLWKLNPQDVYDNRQTWMDLIHPEDKAGVEQAFQDQAAAGKFDQEYRIILPDGQTRWVHDRCFPLRNDVGEIERFTGIAEDITDRKRHQLNEQFLNQLDLRLRQFSDIQAVIEETVSSLGQYLEGNRCTLGKIDPQQDLFIAEWDWCQNASSLIGKHLPISSFTPPAVQAAFIVGQPMVVHDVQTDARTVAVASNYAQIQCRAFVSIPCNYQGRWAAVLTLSSTTPRVWREDEVDLLQDAVARLWSTLEQTRAIQALRESEERFQMALEGFDGGLWTWDLKTNEQYWNSRWLEILGYEAGELPQSFSTWEQLIHPDDRALVLELLQTHLQNDSVPYRFECRMLTKSGAWKWIASYGKVVVWDEQGQPLRMAGIHQDVSDRKQSEEKLRNSEERFRTSEARLKLAYKATRSGLWDWDITHNVAQVSEEYCVLFGLDPTLQTVSYEQWLNCLHPDDRPYALELINHTIEQRQAYFDVEYRVLHPDGVRWLASRAQVFYNEAGDAVRMLGNMQDISDRKYVECERERLLARKQRYADKLRRLTQAALSINSAVTVDAVLNIITDQAYRIIGCHQVAVSLGVDQNESQAVNSVYLSDKYAQWRTSGSEPDSFGFYTAACNQNCLIRMTQVQMEAHPYWQAFSQETDKHPPLRGLLAVPLMSREGQNLGVIQLSDKYEGDFNEEDEAFLMQLAQLASIAIENTHLYEAEQKARAAAERANRIKDEFLAVLSHELRSPLNPILGWTALLQTRKLNEEKTAEALAIISRNAKLQTQLIDDLLDVAKILRGKLSLQVAPVNLVTAIDFAIDIVKTAAMAKSIQIHPKLSNVGYVSGDAARLQQIVWNLLSNAIKFTPNGGRIDIGLERFGNQAQVIVSDTGKGIARDFLPHIFESFRQEDVSTTRKYGGLGLGLAIVRQLVEAHGGTISADSPGEGLGATFIVQIPLLNANLALYPFEVLPEQYPDLGGMRILAVDDDPDSRELLTALLTQYGAEALVVSCAAEVLASVESFHPDLLISDIGMPEVDGYTLIQQVRMLPPERGGQIPAIALTAYARAEDQQRALASGFQQHVVKPLDPTRLVQAAIAVVKGGQAQLSQDVASV
ncbi:MAG TPA: PAS domain-containing protein [Trichocoleus sp.]